MSAEEDGLDGILNSVKMGRWQLLAFLINCLIWSVLSPHTIGNTLLNAPVAFKCNPPDDPYFREYYKKSSEILGVTDFSATESTTVLPVQENETTSTPFDEDDNTTTTLSPDNDDLATTTELLETSTATVESITVNGSSDEPISKYDGHCFDVPPEHILPGIFETDNSSWAVDDHGRLHRLEPWEEENIKGTSYREALLEIAVPSCPSVEYDTSVFTSTITTEWNLICERSLHRQLFQNTYTLGIMVGCVFGGDIGDRLGRVTAIRILAVVHVIFSLIVAFTTNFIALLVARFFVGLSNLGILVPAVTLALETCPGGLRGIVGMAVGLPYSLGVVCFGVLGYFLRSWRYLYMASSFPAFLMLPLSFLLDESPRWLLQKDRIEEAKNVIKKAAKLNRSEIPPDDEMHKMLLNVTQNESAKDENSKSLSFVQKVKFFGKEMASFVATPGIRVISVIMPINWIFSEIIYYGIIFNANNFSQGNPFVYVALTGVSDAVAILIGAPVSKYIGCKKSIALGQFGAGLLTILVLVVPEEIKWLQWILVMGGFLFSAAAAQILYVYTPELYPTTLRSRGFAFCNLTGYAGAFFAPFIPEVLSTFGWWVTDFSLGLAGLLGGIIILTLPETKDLPLCETVEDVERRYQENKLKLLDKKIKKKDEKDFPVKDSDIIGTITGKQNDADLVREIIMTNVNKFSKKDSFRLSKEVEKNYSSSVNNLLEYPAALSTESFGTNNDKSLKEESEEVKKEE